MRPSPAPCHAQGTPVRRPPHRKVMALAAGVALIVGAWFTGEMAFRTDRVAAQPGGAGAGSAGWIDPLPEIASAIRQSVVAVGTYHRNDAPTIVYAGTGFLVDNGLLVATNAHVVDGVRRRDRLADLKVFFPDPNNIREIRGRSATVVAEDELHDVALLRVEGPAGRPLSLKLAIGDDTPRQGQAVAVMGYPVGLQLGLVPAVHRGVIAAVVPAVLPLPRGARMTPQLAEALRQPYDLYQLDLVVFPGNSGSPLIDARDGRVIGIINKALANKTREHMLTDPTGISYAVPVRWVHDLILRSTLTPAGGP